MGIFNLFASKYSLRECEVMKGAVDRHSHILYGVDDGIKTSEESLEALAFEESLGVKEVWCTPHVMEDVPNTSVALKARFEELCSLYDGPVKLHLAAEYMIDTLFDKRLKDRDLLTMEDNMVLMETSTVTPPYDLKGALADTLKANYQPIFAHPERCRFLEVKDCEYLARMGVRFQLNIASLVGYYGQTSQKKAETLLKSGLYYAFGSDCHRVETIRQQYSRPELKKDIIQMLNQIA